MSETSDVTFERAARWLKFDDRAESMAVLKAGGHIQVTSSVARSRLGPSSLVQWRRWKSRHKVSTSAFADACNGQKTLTSRSTSKPVKAPRCWLYRWVGSASGGVEALLCVAPWCSS